mgnify:CR=1 FL=1
MDTQNIQKLSETFFELLGIELEELSVEVQDEERDIYMIKTKTPDSALLIWPHGRTLEELQNLLIQMIENDLERRVLIHLEVNDYLEEKDRKLYSYVERKIADVMRTGSEDTFGPLTGYERKKVHAYVGDKGIEWLRTFSQDGENGERILHIAFDGEIDVSEAIDLDAVEI